MTKHVASRDFSYEGSTFKKGDEVPVRYVARLSSLGFTTEVSPATKATTRKAKEADNGNG
jgi:hypothetical protein